MAMAMAVTPTANVFAYGETSGNSRPAKASVNVKEGDIIEIQFGIKKIQKELLQEKVKLTIHQK